MDRLGVLLVHCSVHLARSLLCSILGMLFIKVGARALMGWGPLARSMPLGQDIQTIALRGSLCRIAA